jgi:predicted PurR-regulated permease PerM
MERDEDTLVLVKDGASDVLRWARRAFIGLAIICWAVLFGAGLWVLAHVARALLLLTIAALLAYALSPLVARLRRSMPQWLAIVLVYLALLAVAAGFGTLVVRTAIEQVSALVAQARALVAPGAGGAPSVLAEALQRFGISQTQLDSWWRALVDQAGTAGREAVPLLTGIANATLDLFLVLVVSIYLLVDGARVGRWLRTATPGRARRRIGSTLDTFQYVVGGYIRGQVTLAALIGVLVGLGMFAIPATRPFGILLGLVAFFLAFIPIIGTLLSGALCVALALPQGIVWGLVVLGYFVLVHVIESDVVGPRIVGESVGLHPVVSIVALVAGAELFGIWGALFAAPVAGVLQAVAADLYAEWKKSQPTEFAGDEPDHAPDREAAHEAALDPAGVAKAAAGAAAGTPAAGGAYRPEEDPPPPTRSADRASPTAPEAEAAATHAPRHGQDRGGAARTGGTADVEDGYAPPAPVE